MDFVTKYLEYTKPFESPTSFWRWSAYSLIAATLRDNVYYDYRGVKIYPNIYAVIIADSAAYRKGNPLKKALEFTREMANTKVYAGSASIQGILEALSQDIPNKKTGVTLKGGQSFLIAEELAAFFVEDPRLIKLLTNMYDYHEDFPYTLRGAPVNVRNMCVTLFAGSNETFLKSVFTQEAIFGGLLRRTFFIKPDERRPGNSMAPLDPIKEEEEKKLAAEKRKELVDFLKEIVKLKGNVNFTLGAAKLYDKWYHDLYASYEKESSGIGLVESIHTMALKLAIIIAASYLTLDITEDFIDKAIDQVTKLKSNYETFTRSSGRASRAAIEVQILDFIFKQEFHRCRVKDIMHKYWHMIEVEDLDSFANKLAKAELLEIYQISSGDFYYKLTDKCINMFKKG